MKKTYSIVLGFILMLISISQAQTTCSTPFPISSDVNHTFTLSTNTVNNDSSNDYGCMLYADNVTWMYFQVCQSGTVELNLGSSGNTSGFDVDYIVYGPLTSLNQCGLDSSMIVACGPATGSTLINFNAFPVGSYYKIMVANFANNPGNFSIYNSSMPFSNAVFDTICTCTIPPLVQTICQVTTDPAINRNIVIWEKDPSYLYDYILQKESTTMGIYSTIATIPNSDSSAYDDLISNPMIQSFKYRIRTTDSCGQLTSGPPHTTIHLLTSLSTGAGHPQLSWNPYIGFSYGTYFIYRGATPVTLSLYDSISASFTSYTDVNPSSGLMYYSIGVSPPSPCQPSRSLSMISLSNTASIVVIGIEEQESIKFTVGPNPAFNEITIGFANIQKDGLIELIDISGRSIMKRNISNTITSTIYVNDISNGYYFLKFSNQEGVSQRRIIINK